MTRPIKPGASAIAGNTSTGMLKLIALLFMFIDHLGAVCFSGVTEMRLLGRIAFPLYCWCMVVGACHTRSMLKYMLRIGLVGLLSQPIYMVALNHEWNVPNIFLTLLIGLGGIWGLQQKRWLSHIWAPVAAMLLSELLNCGVSSYGWKGVLLMMLLWAMRDSRKGVAAMMIAFCLFWGTGGVSVTKIFGVSLTPLTRSEIGAVIAPWFKLQTLAILSLPLILWPDRITLPQWCSPRSEDGEHRPITLRTRMPNPRIPHWLGYAIYPLHLVLLIVIEVIVFISKQAVPAGLSRPETLAWCWDLIIRSKVINYNHLVDAWNAFIALF